MPRPGRLLRPGGLVPYDAANAAMHDLAAARLADEAPDTLILLEHPPVYTAGRRAKPEHIVWPEARMAERGAILRHIDRGGSLTFHGPGQLVGYPIIDLGPRPDALAYVRRLEEVVIRSAAEVGVALERNPVQTGVWSGDRKVCAIGVRLVRMRVSIHGFALNCATDLSWFDAIVPCGLADEGVASLSDLAGRRVNVEEMAPIIAARFAEVFDVALTLDPDPWPAAAADAAAAGSAQ